MNQVCKIVLKNELTSTDSQGFAAFSNINLIRFFLFPFLFKLKLNLFFKNKKRGPQGNYGYKFFVETDKNIDSIETTESYIYINSEVAKMELLPGLHPPNNQTIGEPFKIQPKLRIYDFYNNYLPNKYVIAVSWPEPQIPSADSNEAQKAFIDALKFAYLKGDVSEPSDENGIAVFKNLTVLINFIEDH